VVVVTGGKRRYCSIKCTNKAAYRAMKERDKAGAKTEIEQLKARIAALEAAK
jgi:hypothetical protein